MINNIDKIDKMFHSSYEAKMLYLSCAYFGEEVTIIFEENDICNNIFRLVNCYKSNISHKVDYAKNRPYRDTDKNQIPFRLNDWNVVIEDELCKINLIAHPLYLEFWCKDIQFEQMKKEEMDNFISNNSSNLLI